MKREMVGAFLLVRPMFQLADHLVDFTINLIQPTLARVVFVVVANLNKRNVQSVGEHTSRPIRVVNRPGNIGLAAGEDTVG